MDTKTRQHAWYQKNKSRILKERRAYGKANKQHISERAKDYYARNRETILAKVQEYKDTNREKVLAGKRASYANNRPANVTPRPPKLTHEQKLARRRAYYKRNAPHIRNVRLARHKRISKHLLQQRKDYLNTHPDVAAKIKAYKRVWNEHRRSQKRQTLVTLTKEQVSELLTHCFFCGATSNLTIAHDTPVIKKGNTTRGNVFCLCQSCNSRMGKKSLEEVLIQQSLGI